jgi:MFS family permease
VGVLTDRYGPRRLMAGAAVVCALGSVILALATDVRVAYLGRLLIGAGAAFSWVGTLTLAAQLLPAHRFAMFGGFAQLAGMAGGVVGQAPLGMLVAAAGWRGTILAAAAIGLALAAAIWTLVPEPRPHAAAAGGILSGLRRVAGNPQTWINAVAGMALAGPMLAFGGLWAVPYLSTAYDMPRESAAGIVSLLFVGWGIGAPAMGWLSDRLGTRRGVIMAGLGMALASLALVLYAPGLPLTLVALLFVLNGAGGATMVLTFASARDANPRELSGAALGFVNTAVVGAGALFQPLIGLLLDLGWTGAMAAGARVYAPGSYRAALSVLVVTYAIGIAAALAMREGAERRGG